MFSASANTRVLQNTNRVGVSKPIEYTIVRDKIPLYSVDTHFMMDATTGYVSVSRFSETTYDELVEALNDLNQNGMKQLVVDLRGNPGGYLNQAVKISDLFISGKRKIVYTEGRRKEFDEVYFASEPSKFEDIPYESWAKNVEMQLNAVFYICQKTIEIMKKQNSGSVVNVASIYGVVGNDFTLYEEYGGTSPAAYSAIKGGVINFSRYLASYNGKYNIRVNCVSPGVVVTAMSNNAVYTQDEESLEKIKSYHPLGLGKPEDVANSCMFLLSDASRWITGTNLIVDGGYTAR